MLRPMTEAEAGTGVEWLLLRGDDRAVYDHASGAFSAKPAVPAAALAEHPEVPGLHSGSFDYKAIPDGWYVYAYRDAKSRALLGTEQVLVLGGDDRVPFVASLVPTPAPTPIRTAVIVASFPGDILRYSIERLFGAGGSYDFKVQGFPSNPSDFLSKLAPLAAPDAGPGRGIFRATLPNPKPSPFADGPYQVHVHKGEGAYMVGLQTFQAAAVGGVLRLV